MGSIFGIPGKLADGSVESIVVGGNLARQLITWFTYVHRLGVLHLAKSRFPDLYRDLDGGDKRILRAFLDPDSLSNTWSLLGGGSALGTDGEFRLPAADIVQLLSDAFGTEATFDNSFVERHPEVPARPERWFFLNGIATSRQVARRNVEKLSELFNRRFTLIHNPTQGLTNDLMESSLQKFTNANTEPVARAFLEISRALLDDEVNLVPVIAHSQGTIILGDVLDLIYISIDPKLYDRTNLDDQDWNYFTQYASGTVKAAELRQVAAQLSKKGVPILAKLELYLFANAASRVCYVEAEQKIPHIESYANEHDIVTRLGCLARDDFHEEDLIRIDGSLFTCNRYGHLLNAHYLPDFVAGRFELRNQRVTRSIGSSVHDPVTGNPCLHHPKHVPGPDQSKLRKRLADAQVERAASQPAQARAQQITEPLH